MIRQTVAASLKHLTKLGIVRELTGKERHRLFVYDKCFMEKIEITPEHRI
jgi:predicted alpha-1,6-mannanase (GH76 family)